MIVALDEKINSRLQTWSKHTKQPPEVFINHSLEHALDDSVLLCQLFHCLPSPLFMPFMTRKLLNAS